MRVTRKEMVQSLPENSSDIFVFGKTAAWDMLEFWGAAKKEMKIGSVFQCHHWYLFPLKTHGRLNHSDCRRRL